MKGLARPVLREAIKVGVAAWATISAGPHVALLFPAWSELVVYLVLAVVTALALEVFYTLVLGCPRLKASWTALDGTEENGEVRLQCTARKPTSRRLTITLTAGRTGWLGGLILQRAVRKGMQVRVSINHGPGRFTVEDSTGRPATSPVVADSAGALTFDLNGDPDSNSWCWSQVSFTATAFPATPFTVSHTSVTPGKFAWLYAKVIKVRSHVVTARL